MDGEYLMAPAGEGHSVVTWKICGGLQKTGTKGDDLFKGTRKSYVTVYMFIHF